MTPSNYAVYLYCLIVDINYFIMKGLLYLNQYDLDRIIVCRVMFLIFIDIYSLY